MHKKHYIILLKFVQYAQNKFDKIGILLKTSPTKIDSKEVNIIGDYLHPSRYPEGYEKKLKHILNEIEYRLSEYRNLKNIDFVDVGSGYILVRGFHIEIPNYAYVMVKLKYDFANTEEVINSFVDMWISLDDIKNVSDYQKFIADGEKYGFD